MFLACFQRRPSVFGQFRRELGIRRHVVLSYVMLCETSRGIPNGHNDCTLTRTLAKPWKKSQKSLQLLYSSSYLHTIWTIILYRVKNRRSFMQMLHMKNIFRSQPATLQSDSFFAPCSMPLLPAKQMRMHTCMRVPYLHAKTFQFLSQNMDDDERYAVYNCNNDRMYRDK